VVWAHVISPGRGFFRGFGEFPHKGEPGNLGGTPGGPHKKKKNRVGV